MKRIYIDNEFKCHVMDDGTMTAIETDFFDGKCDAYIEGYVATLDGSNWRITFSFMNGSERWLAELFLSNITGQTRLALVTPDGVMRYLGTIESGATITKKKRKNR